VSAERPSRALFATSNGFGLGHVTRCMAIARRLPDDVESILFTLSEALPIVREQGFFCEYFSSRDAAGETSAQWNGRLERRVRELLEAYRPDAVVFDGTYPYAGMLHALRGSGARRVWCRRGMWRAGEGRANLMFEREFHSVLAPGEAASELDAGATARASRRVTRVPPILLRDPSELLPRERAAERAGVPADGINVLMQPGWENEVFGPSAELCLERLARDPRVNVVVAVSPLRSRAVPLPAGVATVSTYPLASVYRAFDLSICGAGYNIFHELIAYGLPALLVPNAGTPLDDQVGRARYAERAGVGRSWETRGEDELDRHLAALLDDGERAAMARRAEALAFENGAHEAARLVAELAREGGGREAAPRAPAGGPHAVD
jgi:UDP-N-acetylglucosamine--N-acetylmuramyl-(pentapeptide) pyrophosphoryl-undecaprenol N-acetylglucosamine transferase